MPNIKSSIGKKIIVVIGIIFLILCLGLLLVLSVTSFNNLSEVKQAELNRMSHILASRLMEMEANAAQTARNFEADERIVAEIQLLTRLGPYYADPGSYFPDDFMKQNSVDEADQIYVFQAQLNLIQILQSIRQLNNFSAISFYLLPPFDLVPQAQPVLAFQLNDDTIAITQFDHKGVVQHPLIYDLPTAQFQPPPPDYFDISTAYSAAPEQFYRQSQFDRATTEDYTFFFEPAWQSVDQPQSHLILEAGVPVIQTWYPVTVPLANPDTWQETPEPVGLAVIEQRLGPVAMTLLKQQLDVQVDSGQNEPLGLQVGLGQNGQLLITSLAATGPIGSEPTIALNNNQYYYAHQPVYFSDSSQANLEAVVLSPVSELTRLTQSLLWRIALVISIAALLTAVVVWLALNSLVTQPLNELTRGVQYIAAGDLSYEVKVRSQDELGQLATAFNRMTRQLQATLQGLKERTDDLNQANLEIQRYSAEVEAKNVELQRLDKLKDEFLANTSHELRTPLNGIIGLAESMADGAVGPVSSRQQKNLAMIVSSGQRLSALIDDLLDFSKLQHHDLRLHRKPMYLRSLVNVTLMLLRPLVGHKSVELVNDLAQDTPPVYGDKNRVQQILLNLVGNAIKFTEAGRVTVSAKVMTGPAISEVELLPEIIPEQFLAVTVSDTGIGIPTDQQGRIFQAFEQADGSVARAFGGTGIGLAVTKQLVDLHGGQITVQSNPGEGANFTFTLPLSKKTPEAYHEAKTIKPQPADEMDQFDLSATPPTTEATDSEPYHILVVDDEPINRQVLVNQLSLQNYRVTTASDGYEALKLVRSPENPFDLIILDVMMPRMSGYEVCEAIRQQHPATELPIILLTAKNLVTDLVAGLDIGANDYVTKPFSRIELLARIKTHLQLTDMRQLNASKDKFFSIVAHDLKGPFMPLLGTSELLVEMAEFLKPAEVKEMGQSLYRSANSVYTLLENLLQWSRIQMGRLKYQPDRLNLTEIVTRTVDLLQDNADRKNITLHNGLHQPLFVYADEQMLSTVMRNLVSNALKFTPSGGRVTIQAKIKRQPQADTELPNDDSLTNVWAEVAVSDTGVGISPADIDKLFKIEEHHSTVGTAQEKGTGLGLVMCGEMVKQNGGDIWVESEEGVGTTFRFTVPLEDDLPAGEWRELANDLTAEPATASASPAKPSFVAPPLADLEILRDLARIGDMHGIQKQAEYLTHLDDSFQPLANTLTNLATSFEDEKLLVLIEQLMEENP